MISALRAMGYDEELDLSNNDLHVAAHIGVKQSNTTLFVDPNPFMFDGTTLKAIPSLAQKSLLALNDGMKAVFIDEQQVQRRNEDDVISHLNEKGIETLRAKAAPEQVATPAAETAE